MRPIECRFPPKRESRCSFLGTRITGNSGRGHWPPSECTANSFMGCNAWARCRFTLLAGRAHGGRHCEWEAARTLLLSNSSENRAGFRCVGDAARLALLHLFVFVSFDPKIKEV